MIHQIQVGKNYSLKPKKWVKYLKSFEKMDKNLYLSLNYIYKTTINIFNDDDYEISDEEELKEILEDKISNFSKLKINPEILNESCKILWKLFEEGEINI